MTPRKTNGARVALGRALERARTRAGITTGTMLARRLGWQQTKVSKIERGEQLPIVDETVDELELWADQCRSTAAERAEFRELLARAHLRGTTWRDEYQGGDPVVIKAHIAESSPPDFDDPVIRCYAPSIIPRLLQTGAYAREQLEGCNGMVMDLTPEAITALVAQRIKRQLVLNEPGRDVCLVVGEGALHTRFGSEETLVGQLERVVELMELPALDLRVLPFNVPCPIVPLTGFRLVGDAVVIGMFHGEVALSDSRDFVAYTAAFEALWRASLAGEEAEGMIRGAAGELRDRVNTR